MTQPVTAKATTPPNKAHETAAQEGAKVTRFPVNFDVTKRLVNYPTAENRLVYAALKTACVALAVFPLIAELLQNMVYIVANGFYRLLETREPEKPVADQALVKTKELIPTVVASNQTNSTNTTSSEDTTPAAPANPANPASASAPAPAPVVVAPASASASAPAPVVVAPASDPAPVVVAPAPVVVAPVVVAPVVVAPVVVAPASVKESKTQHVTIPTAKTKCEVVRSTLTSATNYVNSHKFVIATGTASGVVAGVATSYFAGLGAVTSTALSLTSTALSLVEPSGVAAGGATSCFAGLGAVASTVSGFGAAVGFGVGHYIANRFFNTAAS